MARLGRGLARGTRGHERRRNRRANPAKRVAGGFWLRQLPRFPAGGDRAGRRRRRRRRADADWRRQIPVLSDPGIAAPGPRRRCLAADRADEGPGRCAGPSRGTRRGVELAPLSGRGGGGRRDGRQWCSRPALCVARAGPDRALPRSARAVPARPLRGRRSSLHLAVGARFPPRIPAALGAQEALSAGAAAGIDRDRRRTDAARHRRPARARSCSSLRRRL